MRGTALGCLVPLECGWLPAAAPHLPSTGALSRILVSHWCPAAYHAPSPPQVFFRFYSKLAGMTGTATAAAAELYEMYGLKVRGARVVGWGHLGLSK